MINLSTQEEFQEFVVGDAPAVLVCSTKTEPLPQPTRSAVERASSSGGVRAAVWYCHDFSDARRTLGIDGENHTVTMFVIFNKSIVDRLVGDRDIQEGVERVCQRIHARSSAARSGIVQLVNEGLHIDVAKMLHQGQELMRKSLHEYAEKFFLKALEVLDAAVGSDDQTALGEEYNGSIAQCLAWVMLSQMVQGRGLSDQSPYFRRLRSDPLRQFAETYRSDPARALATRALMVSAPTTWRPELHSVSKLSSALRENPRNDVDRCMMLVTLFLSGDLERCLTEAMKLHLLGNDFGRVAMSAVTTFLGADDELIIRSGWKASR